MGALYIGGTIVLAQGYHNRPELTESKFIADPFAVPTEADPHPRMYCSGDLGKERPDGNFECLGRIDNQVKISGYRIECGEVEAVIDSSDEVKVSVVVGATDEQSIQRLVAYYESTTGRPCDATALREMVSRSLPPYMIPSIWMHLPSLPLLPNGKIDRSKLPKPQWTAQADAASAAEPAVPPATPTEGLVLEVVRELLGVSGMSTTDNYFALGGNSLFALRVHRTLSQEHGVTNPNFKVPPPRPWPPRHNSTGTGTGADAVAWEYHGRIHTHQRALSGHGDRI